ncbi:hypothetical protein SAMN06265174_102642 [Dietzia kunjamensis subsp. schimae]|uniref:HNH endonuclease n=1 Tax=Dietzia kunjamensis subsp. schimae TaxID=498198 RepID=A0ABY1N062_9ACTN|nr:hypothetical protein [Dietzia kunjamensis subsp. schimae]SMO61663.1 hypothetical protein SAMN06265174_102642 [Dietzia kunjamensis subsp. schimae]
MPSSTDPVDGPWFDDIPLPGMDLGPRAQSFPLRSRPYDPSLPPTEAAIAAFSSRVVKAPGNGCWIWTGAVSDGYGRISWRSAGVSRTEYAHRFALLIAGQLSGGAIGEHRCNEPLCVRVDPEHLIASTQSANLLYAVACGRTGIIRNLTERRDRHARSLAVRDAVAGGWDPDAYARASGNTAPLDTPPLF